MMLEDLEDITPVGVDNFGAKPIALKSKTSVPKQSTKPIIKADITPKSTKFDKIDMEAVINEYDEEDEEDEFQEDDDEYDEEDDNTRTSSKELKAKSKTTTPLPPSHSIYHYRNYQVC